MEDQLVDEIDPRLCHPEQALDDPGHESSQVRMLLGRFGTYGGDETVSILRIVEHRVEVLPDDVRDQGIAAADGQGFEESHDRDKTLDLPRSDCGLEDHIQAGIVGEFTDPIEDRWL